MADSETEAGKNVLRRSLTVRVGVIRDGTQGISLSMGGNLIGEWTDSRARTLCLTNDFKVAICAEDGGRSQLSDAEVKIDFEMRN